MLSASVWRPRAVHGAVYLKAAPVCFLRRRPQCLSGFGGPLGTGLLKPRERVNSHREIKRLVKWGDGASTGRVPETGRVDWLVVEGWAPKLPPGLSDVLIRFLAWCPVPDLLAQLRNKY